MTPPNTILLGATRWLLWFMLALVALGALTVVGISVAMILAWPEVAAEIRNGETLLDPGLIRPQLAMLLALFAFVLVGAAYIIRNLQALVASAAGDPFTLANAARLRAIGWTMFGFQILAVPVRAVASSIAVPTSEFANMGGINFQSILAILLAFILAAIFERGAAMREELDGTV